MKSIRHSVTVLVATVLAFFSSNTPAFARPVPMIESEPGSGVTPASSSGGFLDGWLQVSVTVLIAAALVAIVVAAVSSRMRRPHVLSHA